MFANFANVLFRSMKRTLLSFIALAAFQLTFAQTDVKDRVVAAISSGNVNALAEQFVPSVDLTVLSNSDHYSKAQATGMLRKFFDEHEPQSLRIEHEGASKMGDSYYIGQLATANGTFRVTFFLKRQGESSLVKQLRIENITK